MITCSDAVRQLWSFLDGEVAGPERTALEEHLGVCRRCCGELEFAGELRGFLRAHASEELPAEARTLLTSYLDEL
ncbi:MAG: zf-HC2 domain-containing protein [Actinobacteria bacterium]|nr:zf-HC2 domain-containing protein [Actinomycetota bacterium]